MYGTYNYDICFNKIQRKLSRNFPFVLYSEESNVRLIWKLEFTIICQRLTQLASSNNLKGLISNVV